MKKKTFLLIATIFYTIATIVAPLMGFALLEPSLINLMFIMLVFCVGLAATYWYCDLWIQERRWDNDVRKALKILNREEMKAMFKELDKQGA